MGLTPFTNTKEQANTAYMRLHTHMSVLCITLSNFNLLVQSGEETMSIPAVLLLLVLCLVVGADSVVELSDGSVSINYSLNGLNKDNCCVWYYRLLHFRQSHIHFQDFYLIIDSQSPT